MCREIVFLAHLSKMKRFFVLHNILYKRCSSMVVKQEKKLVFVISNEKERKDEHKFARTTERKSPHNGAEVNVPEVESSAMVLAAALKELREITGTVKQERISQMSDLRNSIQGSFDAITASESTMQGPVTAAEQRVNKISDASVFSKKTTRH